jgi:hypothetical protein
VGDFNILLSPIDRSCKQTKKNQIRNFRIKYIKWNISNGLNRYLYNISFNSCTIHILLCNPRNFLHNRSYFGHKESISCILSDHNGIKPEINCKRNYWKYTNTWILSSTVLNDQYVIKEIRREIKKILEANPNDNIIYKKI